MLVLQCSTSLACIALSPSINKLQQDWESWGLPELGQSHQSCLTCLLGTGGMPKGTNSASRESLSSLCLLPPPPHSGVSLLLQQGSSFPENWGGQNVPSREEPGSLMHEKLPCRTDTGGVESGFGGLCYLRPEDTLPPHCQALRSEGRMLVAGNFAKGAELLCGEDVPVENKAPLPKKLLPSPAHLWNEDASLSQINFWGLLWLCLRQKKSCRFGRQERGKASKTSPFPSLREGIIQRGGCVCVCEFMTVSCSLNSPSRHSFTGLLFALL